MTAEELKKKYIDFFIKEGHRKLPNVSLIPENDSTTLFISAGMQPLVPYLLGEPHPLGKRLTSLQRCLRTGDIEEVGNVFHNTFFEMLGNWSLGDYWKKESLSWSFEFLTKILGLNPRRLNVTIFKGDKDAPRDDEAEKIWRSLGIPKGRIYSLPKEDNWWEAGETGPGGPDSEIFYDMGKPACGPACRPGDRCGRFFEMWNNVFMEYNRKPDGGYEKLKQKNVDTGMGIERTTAVLEEKEDIYKTELFAPIIKVIEDVSGKKYPPSRPSLGKDLRAFRIIADHLRAATFMIADGVAPSNIEQGYILRRLIRRALVSGRSLGIEKEFVFKIAQAVVDSYKDEYSHLKKNEEEIRKSLSSEEEKFAKIISPKTLGRVERQYQQIAGRALKPVEKEIVVSEMTFNLCSTYGVPQEICLEAAREAGLIITDKEEEKVKKAFGKRMEQHRKKSRASLNKKFAGGLADHSEVVTKLHTATHLLHQALRDVLGDHIQQVGSNITPERLRFDFTHSQKLTEKELRKVEKIVNEKIKADLPVKMEMVFLEEAKRKGAQALFVEKYGDKVKLYCVGDYSKEVCGGPHVSSTGELKGVKIVREKSVSTGRRRIYARLVSR